MFTVDVKQKTTTITTMIGKLKQVKAAFVLSSTRLEVFRTLNLTNTIKLYIYIIIYKKKYNVQTTAPIQLLTIFHCKTGNHREKGPVCGEIS